MSCVLLIKSDKELDESLARSLEEANYSVRLDSNWPDAGDDHANIHFSIISGTGAKNIALKSLRCYRMAGGSLPVILISGKQATEKDEIVAYQAGTDEFLGTFDQVDDVLAILKSIGLRPYLRRPCTVSVGSLTVNFDKRRVYTRDGSLVNLTPTEYRILEFLIKHDRHRFSASALVERLWDNPSAVYEETVRSHIKNIRRKLDTVGHASIIETVPGYGYMLNHGEDVFAQSAQDHGQRQNW